MTRRPKIVLYEAQQVNQDRGQFTSYDILPLEMLHIAALPDAEGYEVVIIDASLYSNEESHRRALQACEGAMIFGTTALLGYMVRDGHEIAEKVRAANPKIKIIAGGWFPSCLPEAYLSTGIYDAVCIGQGEVTFMEFIRAVESGANLEQVEGLALWRDGQVHMNPHRAVVGWEQLKRAAWHLIDIAPYRDKQLHKRAKDTRNRMPSPPSVGRGNNYFGISYFSSFGCPEPCTFCCSPFVTNRRWKAIPADRMLDDIQDLKERWNMQMVRFQDANWGVQEKRAKEFCEGLINRGIKIEWTTTMETHAILHYKKETLDLLRDAGLYVALIGAETSDQETMDKYVKKPIKQGDNLLASREMHKRGILSSLTYIIGYPHESEESMHTTLDEARRIVSECPTVSAHVFPFRPIPGSELYQEALTMGYVPPTTLYEWGNQLEYQFTDTWKDNIPMSVKKKLRLYYQYASFVHQLVRPNKRGLIEKISEWRLRSGNYQFPVELSTFYLFNRIMKWGFHKEDEKPTWVMSSENERVASFN